MREITSHRINPANDRLKVEVTDEAGSGGANHRYVVSGFATASNPSANATTAERAEFLFQNGPIAEAGVNGITHEVLIAILIDRLQSFQRGPFSSRENALALTKLEEAAHWLHHRTAQRIARGVEGTHEK